MTPPQLGCPHQRSLGGRRQQDGEPSDERLAMANAHSVADSLLKKRESVALASYERLLSDSRARFLEDSEDEKLVQSWRRAWRFLENNQKNALLESRGKAALPAISSNPDGSIDLFWSEEAMKLLVNIPPGPGEPIEYSGRLPDRKIIDKTDPESSEREIIDLLKG